MISLFNNNYFVKMSSEAAASLAELRDKDLFTQPDGCCFGECPICCLPLSLEEKKSSFMGCCCQSICNGCNYANQTRELSQGLQQRCAFCREPVPETQEEFDKNVMGRVKKNDPVAMRYVGIERYSGGDYNGAVEYLTPAAELGDAAAHYQLSVMYMMGEGVEKDTKKQVYHLEQAAIGGHPDARHNLGAVEGNNGRFERARKHFIIAANLGYNESLKCIRTLYAD